MVQETEKLLIPRIPLTEGESYMREFREEEIAKHDVGDIYTDYFSTTSPPAHVSNEYRITKKDHKGLWGVLIESYVREMNISEV